MQLKLNFKDNGILDKLDVFSDGSEVVDYITTLLDDLTVSNHNDRHPPLHPIALLLLDINMPIMHGLVAFQLIVNIFKSTNERLQKERLSKINAQKLNIERPTNDLRENTINLSLTNGTVSEYKEWNEAPLMILRPLICYYSQHNA